MYSKSAKIEDSGLANYVLALVAPRASNTSSIDKIVSTIFVPQHIVKLLLPVLEKRDDAVTADVVQQQQLHVFSDQLPVTVIDDAIISSARKSLPVTAVRVTLDVCQRALNSCHGYGEEPLSSILSQELLDIHKVCPRVATTLIRLAALTKQVKTSHGVRGAIRRGRTAITRRMYQLAKDTIVKKVEFLLSCKYLGLTADESETYSFSAPLAAALQGCSNGSIFSLGRPTWLLKGIAKEYIQHLLD